MVRTRGIFSLFCFLLGLPLGLFAAWEVWPRGRCSDQPSALRWEYKEEYAVMVAEEYIRCGDLERAEERFVLLGLADPVQVVVDLLEVGSESAPSLAHLTYALGAREISVEAYLPAPSPTSSREFSFRLLESINLGCGEFPEDFIMVYVQDAEGSGVPNVELKISGPQGDDLFHTGLKPEVDVGCADFAFFTPGEYNVRVSEGPSQVAMVTAKPCGRGSHRKCGWSSRRWIEGGNGERAPA